MKATEILTSLVQLRSNETRAIKIVCVILNILIWFWSNETKDLEIHFVGIVI
jgi:hypothetical protein